MADYRGKRRRAEKISLARYVSGKRTARSSRRSADDIVGMRRRIKKSGFRSFIQKNIKFVAIGGFVLVIGVILLFLFVFGKGNMPAASTDAIAEQTRAAVERDTVEEPSEVDESIENANEGVDENMLAGLEGSDDALFADTDEEMADALFAEEGIRIGVTIGDLQSDNDQILLSKLEAASNLAENAKEVYEVYFYNANGDYNQQVQDVRSMIKNDVDVIIVGATEKPQFEMVVAMAGDEGIPVVAYNAPENVGYAINVVADQVAWGSVYGKFMAENIAEGEVMSILGNENSAIDNEREDAIMTALATNENIQTADTVYAGWSVDAAAEAMKKYIEEHRSVDGLITEEGMAEAILDVFIENKTLPKVMCGDATAGFIKKWYALKHEGIDITPPPEEDEEEETPRIMFTANKDEFIVCAQPAPLTIGAVAFEIAVKLAEGRTLNTEGMTYVYETKTLITDDNLIEYYVVVKDQPDSYVVRDTISEEALEGLFQPQEEQKE